MKKFIASFTAVLICLVVPLTSFALEDYPQYTDKKTGTVIALPQKWQETDNSQIGLNCDRLFIYYEKTKDTGETVPDPEECSYIAYSSVDIYPTLKDEIKKSKKRENINIRDFKKADIAKYYDIAEKKVKYAQLSDTEYYYFCVKAKKFTDVFGKKRKVYAYVTVKNAVLYEFMYIGKVDTKPYYNDFIEMVSSVKFNGKSLPVKRQTLSKKKIAVSGVIVVAAIAGFVIVLVKTKD